MANCACLKGVFNYYVEALDRNTIIFQDLSEWMTESGYEVPSTYALTVIPPATSKEYSVNIKVGQLTRLTSDDIGTIKDGVYCFKVPSDGVGCGEGYTRSTALFPKIECCLKQAWVSLGDTKYNELSEIQFHLDQVTRNVQINNVQLAEKELKIAKILLDNLKCDCGC